MPKGAELSENDIVHTYPVPIILAFPFYHILNKMDSTM
jgi:hypothetical protein